MMDRNATKATSVYNKEIEEIEAIIAELQKRLTWHREKQRHNPGDWGYVGDIKHTKVMLRNISNSLIGVEE